jgi:uncharacterized membrane protein SpoIIM required for sporulation
MPLSTRSRDHCDPVALLPLNLGATGVAAFAGAVFAASQQAMPPIRDGVAAGFGETFRAIVSNNLGVALQMLLGVGTFGLSAASVLVWNGFRVGFDVVYVLRTAPHKLSPLLSFVFLEFGSLGILASVAESAGVGLLRYLLAGRSAAPVGRWLLLGVVSLALLLVSAAIEALVIGLRHG